jgi:voltage-gated potassium channel
MLVSLLLLVKFVYDIGKRLILDAYFRSLGILVLIMAGIGTLFFWLVEGRTFLQALAYSAATLAMNSPYGHAWGPATTGGIVFNIVYIFLGVGLFLIFVLEAGKTMVQSYEEFTRKMAERRAVKRATKEAAR